MREELLEFETLLPTIRAFDALQSSVTLRVAHEVLGGNWEALRDGRADLVLRATNEPPVIPKLRWVELGVMEWVFAVSPRHPLAKSKQPLEAWRPPHGDEVVSKCSHLELAHRIRKRQFSFGLGRQRRAWSLKQLWMRPASCGGAASMLTQVTKAKLWSEEGCRRVIRACRSRTLAGRGGRFMRSKLFVPGSRPELFAKALASDADAISFDVEDSVPEDAKARAREQIADFLRSGASGESLRTKIIMVRVNALTSRHFEGDLMAFTCPEVALLNLPKAQHAADIREAAAALERAERRNGLKQPMRLLVNIETPRALRLASELADAHPRVAGLQLGLTDLFESLRIDRQNTHNVHAGMFAVRLASGESGRFAYDSAFPDVADEEGFRREAELARRMGYIGKSCVHPKQVAIANEIFRVDELQLEAARRIVAAARDAAASGRGAFLLDGRMIDLPIIKRAEALLAEANEAPRRS